MDIYEEIFFWFVIQEEILDYTSRYFNVLKKRPFKYLSTEMQNSHSLQVGENSHHFRILRKSGSWWVRRIKGYVVGEVKRSGIYNLGDDGYFFGFSSW
jgi:hypothetical protein